MSRAENDETDTGIATYARLADACGATLILSSAAAARHDDPPPPTSRNAPRNVDPWDWDAVSWMLEHGRVLEANWTPRVLLSHLRHQPNRQRSAPARVREADALASELGVHQVRCYDHKRGKTITRLVRTDADAPPYPSNRTVK